MIYDHQNQDKIAIAGFGFVGQAVNSCMTRACYIYDPPIGLGTMEELIQCGVIFCCLPTPTVNFKQDFSAYRSFLNELVSIKYSGLLIIKSTILWKNIQPYTTKLNIVVNPEFLNQNNFQKDFYNQKMLILGGRIDLCKIAKDVFINNFEFKNQVDFEFCSVQEAIELKYAHNVYHAYKILFWNYIHEVIGNQRKIFDLYARLTGNTNEMARVYADGKPGYGGACFPKDVKAMHEERPHELTKFMIEFNQRIRGE